MFTTLWRSISSGRRLPNVHLSNALALSTNRKTPFSLLAVAALVASVSTLGGAGAQVITEFSAGITASAGPGGITAGPDGNLWFTENYIDRIGRITPDGVVTEFSAGITAGARPNAIAAGADGSLWFTEPGVGQIGRITPAGIVTEFSAGTGAGNPNAITAGPDGNLWFTAARFCDSGSCIALHKIGRITPLGVVTLFNAGGLPSGITAGPDGNLWFRDELGFGGRIGQITPLGVVTEFGGGLGLFDSGITAGPDGNLWFTEGSSNRIGRITPQGAVTQFSTGIAAGAGLARITAGPDGHLWFTERLANRIGRIDPLTGTITEFSVGLSAGAVPGVITAGPDGNLWFTEPGVNRIGRITACLNEAACSPSTTTLASSLNPSHVGQAVVFTASVVGNFPTGTVQFMDGGSNLGSPVTLSGGGIAQLMTSTLTKGAHTIGAVYSGDNNNAPSAPPVLSQIVKKGRRGR